MKTLLSLTVMLIAVLCLNLNQTSGQDYDISEDTLDFGGVQIGSSETDVITITNNDIYDIIIFDYSINNDPSNVFSLVSNPINVGIGTNGSYDVEVEFTPSTDDYYEAELEIYIRTFYGDITEVITLIGNSTSYDDPRDLVDDIRKFYRDSLADGTLDGTGSGKRARRRERALRCRLRAISYLCRHGYFCYASWVTQSAIKRTDGLGCPRDFVAGSNLEALNNDLILLNVLLQN